MSGSSAVIELELYLVRHGYSRGNAGIPAETIEEYHNPGLTELGQRQAELLGERFSALPLDCIISSGLERAIVTAEEVAKRQPENGFHNVEVHPLFTEINLPEDYPGHTFEEIHASHPDTLAAPGTEKYTRFAISSMTHESQRARAREAVDYLRSRFKNGEKVLVAAHGAFNTDIFFTALKIEDPPAFDISFFNTNVTKIVFYKEGTGYYNCDVGLIYANDCSHLAAEFPTYTLNKL